MRERILDRIFDPLFNRIRAAFLDYGWLLPLLTPAAQAGGRALVNILLLFYLLWALIALPGMRVRLERPAVLLWGALLLAYLFGIPGALDPASAFHEWTKFALHMCSFIVTLTVLTAQPEALQRLTRALGLAGLLLLAALLIKLPWSMSRADFQPYTHLIEDNLPFLLPFSVFYLAQLGERRYGRWAALVVLAIALAYIAFSHGRAALVGLTAALLMYGIFVLRWQVWRVALVLALLLGAAVAISYDSFFRNADLADWGAWLDTFTSYRSQLWRQALEHPPQNALLGVGMANVGLYNDVVVVHGLRLGHLHNFVLDAWYETGWLGLIALLAFVAVPLAGGWRIARTGAGNAMDGNAIQAGLYLASAAALLVAGLLSFSYTSRQFALYLPMLLAALWHLRRRYGTD